MKTILIPTDFSKNAFRAIEYGLNLFESDPCEFYLLNVFSMTGNLMKSLMNMDPGSEFFEKAKAYSESELSKTVRQIDIRPHHTFNCISRFNTPLEAIKQIVDEKDIDLIIMGTKGERDSLHSVYGSTAVSVMEKVRNCPVLVIPQNAALQKPKEIVFPTNYRIPFKKKELGYLVDIAAKSNATIQVLYINEGTLSELQLENKDLLEDSLKDINHRYRTLRHMHVPTAISCFIESRESDMLAFINKKHLFFGSILSQALVKEIGYDSKVPILVMHDLKN